MRIQYGGKYKPILDASYSEIRKSGILSEKTIRDNKININKVIKNYFNYIKNDSYLYKKSTKQLYDESIKNEIITLNDGFLMEFRYYFLKSPNIRVCGKFVSIKKKGDSIDMCKTETSFLANIIHGIDSTIVRSTLSNYKIICIHDSFGIDILNIPIFMDFINLEYCKSPLKTDAKLHAIKSKKYSPHILI